MPKTDIRIYQELDGSAPLIKWLDDLPLKARDKCIVRIELLAELGHELRRPICGYLEQGIYELRARHRNVNYRILYAFEGKNVVLLSHGCTKERKVPKREIQKAAVNRRSYARNPKAHTYRGEL